MNRSSALGALSLSLMIISSTAFANFCVQVGAFSTELEAETVANNVGDAVLGSSATVRPESSDKKGLLYKVLVGNYESRGEAADACESLANAGFKGYIRSAESYDKQLVHALIQGNETTEYFKTTGTVAAELSTTYALELKSRRDGILKGETTSPQRLRDYREYLLTFSDSDPGKAREIVTLAHLATKGRSIYRGERAEFETVQNLLRKVADGQITATVSDRMAARALVAHYLHYYARTYSEALSAYAQLLQERQKTNDDAGIAKVRMEIAAASFELTKTSGYNWAELQKRVFALWNDAVEMQNAHLGDNDNVSKAVRAYTLRIGLMLSEIMMGQKLWPEAGELASSLVAMYKEYPECYGEVAEAHCHLARIKLEQGNAAGSIAAAEEAIKFADKPGRTKFGDIYRDPLWKAYAWKHTALAKSGATAKERFLHKQEMIKRFPNHPGLKKYFKGID